MNKNLSVFHSPFAERKLKKLLDYIESEWGSKAKSKFIYNYSKTIKQISTHPKSCPESEFNPGIFRCILTKQTSILYRIYDNTIEIITFFDNRQNQKEIFIEIKNYFA